MSSHCLLTLYIRPGSCWGRLYGLDTGSSSRHSPYPVLIRNDQKNDFKQKKPKTNKRQTQGVQDEGTATESTLSLLRFTLFYILSELSLIQGPNLTHSVKIWMVIVSKCAELTSDRHSLSILIRKRPYDPPE